MERFERVCGRLADEIPKWIAEQEADAKGDSDPYERPDDPAPQLLEMLQEGHADLVAMARELMIHADWPLRAAKELAAGHYDLMAPSIAHRLRRRDEQSVAHPPGSEVQIPVAAGRSESRAPPRARR